MTTVKNIADFFSEKIPQEMKMDFDNVGLLVGLESEKVTCVLLALDITDAVISEAKGLGAQLIISHHPIFFDLKRVSSEDASSAKVVRLLRHGISALCLHTNFDGMDGGVNDALAKALGVKVTGRLEDLALADGTAYGIGRYGELAAPMALPDYLAFVKKSLDSNGLRYCDGGAPVQRVALCGGSGGEYVERALELGCDTLVTADVKYHQMLDAKERGLSVIDADHFCTENVAMPVLADMLEARFSDVEAHIATVHGQTAQFF